MRSSLTVMMTLGLILALTSVPPLNGADLAVTSSASMGASQPASPCSGDGRPGPCGLEITFDGTTAKSFVKSDSPSNESIYRARFWWNPNNLGTDSRLDEGETFIILRTTDVNGTPNSGGVEQAAFQVLARYKSDKGLRTWVRLVTNNYPPPNARFSNRIDLDPNGGPVQLEVEWVQGDVCGELSGLVTLRAIDGQQAGKEVSAVANNCELDVDDIILGLVTYAEDFGSPLNGTSMYFDEFESFRSLSAAP